MTTICIELICMPEIAKLEIMCVATHLNLLDCTPANLSCIPFHVVNNMLGDCAQGTHPNQKCFSKVYTLPSNIM